MCMSKMDQYMNLTLLFFGFGLSSCSQVFVHEYFYVNLKLSWTEAQKYCREKNSDLATFESMDDVRRLKADLSYDWAWIGLSDDPKTWKTSMGNEANSWRWSATGGTSQTGYQRWKSGEPSFYQAEENCAFIHNGQWDDRSCDEHKTFVCYNVSAENKKNYVYVPTETTWTSAQEYCRKHYTDLAMIENEQENTQVNAVAPAAVGTWIGLYRVPWTWSDKSQSSFQNWNTYFLNNDGSKQHCASENPNHEWDDAACDSTYVFICQQVVKRTTSVRMRILTDADLTDPEINSQILQQLNVLLASRGFTDVNLRWKTQPIKEEEEEECKKDHCTSNL